MSGPTFDVDEWGPTVFYAPDEDGELTMFIDTANAPTDEQLRRATEELFAAYPSIKAQWESYRSVEPVSIEDLRWGLGEPSPPAPGMPRTSWLDLLDRELPAVDMPAFGTNEGPRTVARQARLRDGCS